MQTYMSKGSTTKNSESRFLLITGTLVAVLGLPIFISVIGGSNDDVVQVRVSSSRAPASTDVPRSELSRTSAETLKVSCKPGNVSQIVDSPRVRIKGSGCKPQIENKTSGYVASIISENKNDFTTDYIDLVNGQNTIQMQNKDSHGHWVTKIISISKRAPASQ